MNWFRKAVQTWETSYKTNKKVSDEDMKQLKILFRVQLSKVERTEDGMKLYLQDADEMMKNFLQSKGYL